MVRNMTVFNKIPDELARKGYQHNTKQCWEKLKQLKKNTGKLHQGKYDSLASSKSVVALAK